MPNGPPNAPPLSTLGVQSIPKNPVVVRNTFLDVQAPNEWDDDEGMGFRSTSDPTSWKPAVPPKVVAQFGDLAVPSNLYRLTSPASSLDGSDVIGMPPTPDMTPVACRAPLGLAQGMMASASASAAVTGDAPPIPSNVDFLEDEDEEGDHPLLAPPVPSMASMLKMRQPQGLNPQANAFIVKNTFVDGYGAQREEEDESGFGFRSMSDPTHGCPWGNSSSRKFQPSPALGCPPLEEEDEDEFEDCIEEAVAEGTAQQVQFELPLEDGGVDRSKEALSLVDLVAGPDFDPTTAAEMNGYSQDNATYYGAAAAYYNPYFGGYYPQANGMEFAGAGELSMGDYHQGTMQMGGAESSSGSSSLSFGTLHSFHSEFSTMGQLRADARQFTKEAYEGRLSVISESQVHTGGLHRYLVQFSGGELSKADGVGFIFSPRLPCKKNIQRIVSIFANQHGQICMRMFENLIRADVCVEPLKLGDWVEMAMDLDNHTVTFCTWPADGLSGAGPSSRAVFCFGEMLKNFYDKAQNSSRRLDFRKGHLACVVKNAGVTVTLGS